MTAPPDSAPRVSAVIVSYNTREDLLRCLESVRKHAGLPVEVLVVDNASTDGSAEAARRALPEARVIESPANLGFSRANNLGLLEARGAYVLFLNSDAQLLPGALTALVDVLDARPDVGIVGPRTLDPDGSPQVSFGPALGPIAELGQRRLVRGVRARRAWALAAAEQASRVEREPGWVSASCLLARREALDAVGGFDEGFFLYEEDVDLCVRMKRSGWRVVFTPLAEVVHRLGTSMARAPARARLEYHRSHLRYYRKHLGPLAAACLRLFLMAGSALAWSAALGPGQMRRARRAEALDTLALAWRGE